MHRHWFRAAPVVEHATLRGVTVEQWEYHVENKLPTGTKFQRRLNELGRDGWELVFINQDTSGLMKGSIQNYIFKRRVR
jgi:hypothetical protein